MYPMRPVVIHQTAVPFCLRVSFFASPPWSRNYNENSSSPFISLHLRHFLPLLSPPYIGHLAMKKKRNLFRKKKAQSIEDEVIVNDALILKCGEKRVVGVACIPTHELIAVATYEGVYVHEYSNQGEPFRVFDGHKTEVRGVVHLCDDILTSVSSGGMLRTWRARTGVVLDQVKVSVSGCCSITKASGTEVLVGTWKGEVVLVAHMVGKNLTVKNRCKCDHGLPIYDISAYNDVFAAVKNSKVGIWNYFTGKRLHSIQHEDVIFRCSAVSNDLIVLGTEGYKIYIHELRDEYKLLRTINLGNIFHLKDYSYIGDIPFGMTFLNADLVMITTDYEGIFFVSAQSGQCISRFRLGNSNNLYQATVLSDGRVCVGGTDGYCSVLALPQETDIFISEYTERMYSHPVFSLIPFFSEPLQATIEAVQSNAVSIGLAVDIVVNTKYPFESIEKWTRAHLIVMAAVKSGDVPPTRKYNGDVIFWWNYLYKKASLIEMGKEDRQRVLQFMIEAEKVGILGGGCAETFQVAKEIRSEMNVLSATIDDLYASQIAMAKQVQSILHYVKVQKAMAFVNVVLACIPVAGNIAVHALTGGLAFLENAEGQDGFAVGGLVESLFGIGKDWSSFITEPIVERFIKAGDVVLEEKTWNELPDANRRAVEAAADGLGLSIDEIRSGFRDAAQEESPTIVVEVEEEDIGIVADGDEGGTVVVSATAESMANLRTGTNVNRDRIENVHSRLGEKKSEERDVAELWNLMERMQLKMKKEEGRREMLEARNKRLEETMARMEVRNKTQEEKIAGMVARNKAREEN